MSLNQLAVSMFFVGVTLSAAATCPMFDSLRYGELDLAIHKNTNFPESPAYAQWAREWPFCSAVNQGRAVYAIDGNKVFLVGFRACGLEKKATDIYPGTTNRVLATWLNGELQAYGGKNYCLSGMCMVGDTRFTFALQDGLVTSAKDEPSQACQGVK